MKVSIITIVRNNKYHIADCINSVIEQSYKNIEHIVIDGGSTDGTVEQIETIKHKLAYFISENDKGLYNALNKGILKSTGDIVGILHSDDVFHDANSVQAVVDTFLKTDADLVYAKGKYVERVNINKTKRIYPSKIFKKKYLAFGWIPLHTTIYVKREIFNKFGLYEEQYKIASDYEISLRWFVCKEIKKVYLDKWVVKMRLGGKSTTINLQKLKSTEDLHIIHKYRLLGLFTLACKVLRKIPQYIIPQIKNFR